MRDQARERPLTGEESSYEQPLEETNTAIHRGLGTMASDKLETLLEVTRSVSSSNIIIILSMSRVMAGASCLRTRTSQLITRLCSTARGARPSWPASPGPGRTSWWRGPPSSWTAPAGGTSSRSRGILGRKNHEEIFRACWATAGCCPPAPRWPRRSRCCTECWTPPRCCTAPATQVILAPDWCRQVT